MWHIEQCLGLGLQHTFLGQKIQPPTVGYCMACRIRLLFEYRVLPVQNDRKVPSSPLGGLHIPGYLVPSQDQCQGLERPHLQTPDTSHCVHVTTPKTCCPLTSPYSVKLFSSSTFFGFILFFCSFFQEDIAVSNFNIFSLVKNVHVKV